MFSINFDIFDPLSLLLSGTVFFFTSHFLVKKSTEVFVPRLRDADRYVIACRCVSALQAIICTAIGAVIASSCSDILKDIHWLTNSYVYFGVPYFPYDLWAMYAYHSRCHSDQYRDLGLWNRISLYARKNKLMVFHHVVLPAILLPVILILRENRGDFFFGVFYMMEFVIPFISLREILVQLNMKYSAIYIYSSVAMIVSFFCCRILIFPYLYHAYANYADISFLEVPHHIPIKCNISCVLILLPQVYWFYLMMQGLYRKLYNSRTKTNPVVNGVDKNHLS